MYMYMCNFFTSRLYGFAPPLYSISIADIIDASIPITDLP